MERQRDAPVTGLGPKKYRREEESRAHIHGSMKKHPRCLSGIHHTIGAAQAPIPCTHLCPDTEKDSCPIVSEPVHVTFANDRLWSSVSLRCER